MDSFQAKTARHRRRMIYKKKSYRSDPFQPYPKWGIRKKIRKKFKKLKKHHYGFFSSQNSQDRLRMREKKIYCSNPFQPNLEQGIPTKQHKKHKKFKNIIMASFQAKARRDRLRVMEKKCYHSDIFQPDPEQGIPEKQQKNIEIKKHRYGFFSIQKRDGTCWE